MVIWAIALIYVLAAVVPAFFLARRIFNMDRVEKEPVSLLFRLLLLGVLSALIAGTLEMVGIELLDRTISQDSAWYVIFLAFLVVAVSEEGAKYLLMKHATWNNPEFNYRFDGIVYAAFVSLGFAAFENIKYVFNYGLSVAPLRAVLSIPGHLAFSVYMGYFYGRARMFQNYGYEGRSKFNRYFSYGIAVFLHGFYDACAMMGTGLSSALFIAFVCVCYTMTFKTVLRESKTDYPIR